MFFIILATQRSGTTFLSSILAGHPQLCVLPEVFLPSQEPHTFYAYWHRKLMSDPAWLGPQLRGDLLRAFLAEITSSSVYDKFLTLDAADRRRLVGINVKYDALTSEGKYFQGALEEVLWSQETRIIHLVRRNYLRTICSSLLNDKQRELGRAANQTVKPPPISIELPTDARLIGLLQDSADRVREVRHLLSNARNHMEIYYEDFFDDGIWEADTIRPELAARIFDFLEVARHPASLRTDVVKLNPYQIEDLIANYESVAETLRGSDFEEFLYQ